MIAMSVESLLHPVGRILGEHGPCAPNPLWHHGPTANEPIPTPRTSRAGLVSGRLEAKFRELRELNSMSRF